MRERGVSLFELLVVVAIIAVLSLVVGSNLPAAREQAATTACQTNLRAIATAAEQYYAAAAVYPTASGSSVTPSLFTRGSVAYLANAPTDPAYDPNVSGDSNSYSYTGGGSSYTVTCGSKHSPASLSSLPLKSGTSYTENGGASCSTCKLAVDNSGKISTQ